jgi:hypothetical protein
VRGAGTGKKPQSTLALLSIDAVEHEQLKVHEIECTAEAL